jgi:hypothetical protein
VADAADRAFLQRLEGLSDEPPASAKAAKPNVTTAIIKRLRRSGGRDCARQREGAHAATRPDRPVVERDDALRLLTTRGRASQEERHAAALNPRIGRGSFWPCGCRGCGRLSAKTIAGRLASARAIATLALASGRRSTRRRLPGIPRPREAPARARRVAASLREHSG